MGKRIRNFRSGDRAEDLGIFLMKAFCAVAPIPRQEDFGLADAVATLLRPEGRFWYAEDSFLVQFKSRTEKKVNLSGPVFARWIAQDLSVFLGRVNLLENSVELFTFGSALCDPRVHEAHGLVVWLRGGNEGVHDGVLHLKLEKPILRWSVADTEDNQFTDRTYEILKRWLKLERWNRRYFRAGVARAITWKTDEMPEVGGILHTWTPAHGLEAVAEIEPLVHLIGLHAHLHPQLWTRVHAIEEALRGPNDPNMIASMRPFLQLTDATSRLRMIIKSHPAADAVVVVQILRLDKEGANFWVHSCGRDGNGMSQRYEGTWDELKQKGFDCQIEANAPNKNITLSLDRYFATTPIPYEIIEGPKEAPHVDLGDHSPCFFLRRATSDPPAGEATQ